MALWDKGGLYFSEEATNEISDTGTPGRHRLEEDPVPSKRYISITAPSISLTVPWHQVLVGVTLLTLESALHAHKHYWSFAMTHSTSGAGATWSLSTSWGVIYQEGRVGPFYFCWFFQCDPVALPYHYKVIKSLNVQLLKLQGICWIHGWFVGEGLFVDTLLYLSCY